MALGVILRVAKIIFSLEIITKGSGVCLIGRELFTTLLVFACISVLTVNLFSFVHSNIILAHFILDPIMMENEVQKSLRFVVINTPIYIEQ